MWSLLFYPRFSVYKCVYMCVDIFSLILCLRTACWHDEIVFEKENKYRASYIHKKEIGTARMNETLSCITMHTYVHTYIRTIVFVLDMHHKMCSRSKPLLSFDLVSSSSSSSTCYASLMLFLFLFILYFFWGVKSLPHVVAFFLYDSTKMQRYQKQELVEVSQVWDGSCYFFVSQRNR